MNECPQCGIPIEDGEFKCGYCKSNLIGEKGSSTSSCVYILTNSAMPGLVKIGYTDIDPYERAKQLSATNVPTPFKIYGYVTVNKPKEVEKAVHKKLSKFRKSKSREFFKIKPEEAVKILENVSGKFELKRRLEAEETSRRKREEKNRKKQEKFERQVFSALNTVCEKLEERSNFKIYKKLEYHSGILAWIFFISGIISFNFLKTDVIILIGIAWAIVGLIHLILSKIANEKFDFFKKDVCRIMEGQLANKWNTYEKICIDKMYEKYIRNV